MVGAPFDYVYEMGPLETGTPLNIVLYYGSSVKVKFSKSALKFESSAFYFGVCWYELVMGLPS